MTEQTESTTTVEVIVRGRHATVEDVQDALDTLRAEGIPDTFDVEIYQREDRIPEEGVEYRHQRREHVLTVRASRAARTERANA